MRLSIIVPVYNTEKYLDDCFASLIDQDIDDYEIICVNDGSKDGSLAKINEWAAEYPDKFVVIDKENGGVSAARNEGLKVASGKYVWFIDADDFIDGNCLGALIQKMEHNNLDMTIIGIKAMPESQKYISHQQKCKIFEQKKKYTNANFGNKIVSRDLLTGNNIQWDTDMSYAEDIMFQFKISLYTRRIKHIGGANYYYRINPTSAMRSHSIERSKKWRDSVIKMGEIYSIELEKRKDEPIASNIKRRLHWSTMGLLFNAAISMDDKEVKEFLDDLKKRGWYPYPLLWEKLKPFKSLKTTMMNWSQFLFPFEWYYLLFCKTIKKVPGAKKYAQ